MTDTIENVTLDQSFYLRNAPVLIAVTGEWDQPETITLTDQQGGTGTGTIDMVDPVSIEDSTGATWTLESNNGAEAVLTGIATVGASLAVHAGDATTVITLPVQATVAEYVGAVCSPVGGCPSNVNTWLARNADTFNGSNRANKVFYSGNQPMTTWDKGHLSTDNESLLPHGTLVVVCYDDNHISSLPGWINSVPEDADVLLAYKQEAENKGGSPATFIANTIKCSNTIRAQGHPGVRVLQNCAGSKYRPGALAADGSWAVDPEFIDVYSIDCYRNQGPGGWPVGGLANYDEFLGWLDVYAGRGPQLAITEYGLDNCQPAGARAAAILEDVAYLKTAFGGGPDAVSPDPLACLIYWNSNCQAGQLMTDCAHMHQLTEPDEIAAWNSVMAGTA